MLTSVQDLGTLGIPVERGPGRGGDGSSRAETWQYDGRKPGKCRGSRGHAHGAEIEIKGGGAAVFAGAELGFSVNGKEVGSWNVVLLNDGDVDNLQRSQGKGCRGEPLFCRRDRCRPVMGSRSTYTRRR
jgi:hypothetical protein